MKVRRPSPRNNSFLDRISREIAASVKVWVDWWTRWWGSTASAGKRPPTRPELEGLGDRVVLSNFLFIGNGATNPWNDPGSWKRTFGDTGTYPGDDPNREDGAFFDAADPDGSNGNVTLSHGDVQIQKISIKNYVFD